MPARISGLLFGSLVLSACAPAASTSSVPPASAGSPALGDAPPSVAITWPDGARPAVTRQQAGTDERYINPGAVIEHDGLLHMFANAFTAWPGPVQVQHLVSSDGVSWTLDAAEPVLSSEDVPLGGLGADVSTGFVAEDGTWVLIFETVGSLEPWILGRATAPAPEGPWTVNPVPILESGGEGSWDAGGLSWPSVIRTPAGYAMYYTGLDRPGGTGVIGMAESTDGMAWTKRDAPVLEAARDWEGGSLDRPRVAVTPAGMVMVYAGADLTDRGLAWSNDGVTWRRDGDAPVITQDDFPVDGRAWDAALIFRDGTLIYYLEIGVASPSGGTHIYRAVVELPGG